MDYTLENPSVRLTFDSQQLMFVSIENRKCGEQIVKKSVPTPLCQIACLRQGQTEKEVCVPYGIPRVMQTRDRDKQEINLHFDQLSNGRDCLPVSADIRVQLEGESSESVWRLRLENRTTDVDIVEALFPYLRGISLGDDWQDDVILYPHHAGEKTVAPIREYTSPRFTGFSRAETCKEGDLWSREINYCGLASMMWMYYYDPTGGLYFASHDEDFLVTGLRVETGGPQDPWMGFAFRKYHRVLPGQTWDSQPYVLALSDADWHWGARRYRAWIMPHLRVQPNPPFLADESSLTKCYSLKREGKVLQTYSRLPRVYEEGQKTFGSRHIFVASWNRGGFDTDYPEYQPDMDLGSPMDLANACRDIRNAGGHVTFYINSQNL